MKATIVTYVGKAADDTWFSPLGDIGGLSTVIRTDVLALREAGFTVNVVPWTMAAVKALRGDPPWFTLLHTYDDYRVTERAIRYLHKLGSTVVLRTDHRCMRGGKDGHVFQLRAHADAYMFLSYQDALWANKYRYVADALLPSLVLPAEQPVELPALPFLVFLSRPLDPLKGLERFLQEGWPKVLKKAPNALLLVIGTVPDVEEHRLGLKAWKQPRVHVRAKTLTPAQVRFVLHRCQALLVPSEADAYGILPLEAIACGTPVVSWKPGTWAHPMEPRLRWPVPCFRDYVPDYPYLVPAFDYRAMAEVCADLAKRRPNQAPDMSRFQQQVPSATPEQVTQIGASAYLRLWKTLRKE